MVVYFVVNVGVNPILTLLNSIEKIFSKTVTTTNITTIITTIVNLLFCIYIYYLLC
jgi:hypothetical protein